MEVNISHRCRQDILITADLAQPDLFRNALNELVQLMIMVSSSPEKFIILLACLCMRPDTTIINVTFSFLYLLSRSLLKNLAKDYWSSTFFLKFKEEANMWAIDHDLEQATTGWNFSPRLSSVHGIDDPFHQDQPSKDPDHVHDLDLQ